MPTAPGPRFRRAASADVQFGSSAGEDGGFIVYNNALYFNASSDTIGTDTLFKLAAGSTTPVLVDPTGTLLSHESGCRAPSTCSTAISISTG